MVDRDLVFRAIARYQVVGLNDRVDRLAELLDRVLTAQGESGIDESALDLTGERAGVDLEGATMAGREVIRSCITASKGRFDAPCLIGDVDPLISAAIDNVIVPDGLDSLAYAGEIADATRRIARRIADALRGAAVDDLRLLASATPHSNPGRPPKDLALVRRAVRAAYFFSEQAGLDMRRGWTRSGVPAPTGNLSRLAMACVEAVQPPADARSVRTELAAYRSSLGRETEMKGDHEYRPASEADFLFIDTFIWPDHKAVEKGGEQIG